MTDKLRLTVQRAVGWLIAFAFVGLAYLSMSPGYELTLPVIVGVIIVIGMLLGKIDALADLLERWQGR